MKKCLPYSLYFLQKKSKYIVRVKARKRGLVNQNKHSHFGGINKNKTIVHLVKLVLRDIFYHKLKMLFGKIFSFGYIKTNYITTKFIFAFIKIIL